jgi:hypothetical protein
MIVAILLAVALILVGAVEAKPIGWVVIVLAVLALLLAVLGGFNIPIGK